MKAQAVIAVRGGGGAKTRLAAHLPPEARHRLTAAMLSDMLTALNASPSVARTHVITPTPDLADTAFTFGAKVIFERAPGGLNAAFAAAHARLRARAGPHPLLFLPGDLPLLAPADVEAALGAFAPGLAVLAPSWTDGGTGCIAVAAWEPFAFQFGPDSFRRHVIAAHEQGLDVRIVSTPALCFDLDRPDDIARATHCALGAHTAAALDQAMTQFKVVP